LSKELAYIKRKTKGMTPAERFMWLEKNIYNPLRLESIKWVNGEPVQVPDEPSFIAEAFLEKDKEPIDGAYAD
jgi:hypothetical protein